MGLAVTKQEALWEACGYGQIARVKSLIEEGIDVNWVSYTVSSLFIYLQLAYCAFIFVEIAWSKTMTEPSRKSIHL